MSTRIETRRAGLVPAQAGDLPALQTMMQAFYALDGLEYTSAVEGALTELLERPEAGQIWLVEQAGQGVGYAVATFWFSLEFRGLTAFLDEIYLIESVRHQGLGGEIIDAIADYCRQRGARSLRLEVEHENTRAQRAYAKAGFFTHARHLMTRWL